MTVVSSHKNVHDLTLTFVADFDAEVGRVWQLWEDPRQLERWWGPPTVPATFDQLEATPGGDARYYMTLPEGQKAYGWWKILVVEAPHRFAFDEGFAGDDGEPLDPSDSARCDVTLEENAGVTRMTIVATFKSTEQMQQMLEMGMEEGMAEALGQIDAILAESPVHR